MSNEEDKNPSPNGLGTNPLQRLASFKAPRDLSLGGVKPNRKIFTPNLNVTRNKNKGPNTANARDQKRDEKDRRDRKNDRNKNLRNGPNIIKSSGVFSEGLGSTERHSSRSSYSSRDTESAPALRKPTIRVKDVIKIDQELENQKIKALYGDDGNEEYDEEDFKQGLEADAPVKLPMDDAGYLNQKKREWGAKKQAVKVKQEPGEDSAMSMVDTKPILDVKEAFEDTTLMNLFRSDKPALMLLQLPDTLPGRGGSSEDDGPRRKHTDEPSTSAGDDEKPAENRCTLSDLEEGRIGKLQVHRSGRVTLLLGDTRFEVSSGTKAAFHQEAVSVAVDDASRSANLIALGPIQHKLNVIPHWEAMFHDMSV